MKITREDFLNKYGERWYLRDFDFYPERLSDRIERQHDISFPFLRQLLSEDGTDKIFKTERQALIACLDVREKLGLENSASLKARAFDALYQDFKNDIGIKAILLDDFVNLTKY